MRRYTQGDTVIETRMENEKTGAAVAHVVGIMERSESEIGWAPSPRTVEGLAPGVYLVFVRGTIDGQTITQYVDQIEILAAT